MPQRKNDDVEPGGSQLPLRDWLGAAERDPQRSERFETTDMREHTAPGEEMVRRLAELLIHSKTDEALLDRMAAAIGWEDASARLKHSKTSSLSRGDFGEAVTCQLLEDFDLFVVPIRKLRYQTDPDHSLGGTDIVGFRISEQGSIDELHFVECKLRTTADNAQAVEAHKQLADDRTEGFADVVMFLAERLNELADPALLDAYVAYLTDRAREDRGTYGIVLMYDVTAWRETVLDRLEELEVLVSPLHVRVVLIESLAALVDAAYAEIGAEAADD